MLYFNYNGKIFSATTPVILPDSRSLKYGDGLFETFKYKNGHLILIDEHLSRLWKGMQLMQFDIPTLISPDNLQQQIIILLKKNKQTSARIRLTIIRSNGGLYDAQNMKPDYIIQSWALSNDTAFINENGMQLSIYRDAKKSIDLFSNIKHNNYLPQVMGAIYAKKEQSNDAIILNSNNCICETTISNIFLIKDGIIFTPSLAEGCVAGIMRKFIIHQLAKSSHLIIESQITEDMLMNADELFLTNAMYNLRWVASVENKKYQSIKTKEIYKQLCQTNPSVFC